MNIAQRSMMNSQTGLQTVSHNIANKNTEGYSRQRVEFATTRPTDMGRYQIGTGAKTQTVARINNPHLEKQIEGEQQKLGFGDGKTTYLDRVEQVFNEQANNGLNNRLSDFFNAFRELANQPESLPIRTQVKETAAQLVQNFKKTNDDLKQIQAEVDHEIEGQLSEINALTAEIADLNEKVEHSEMAGAPANDARDRRDHLLKTLGEKINIKYTEVDKGKVSVVAGNNIILVSGYENAELKAAATPEHGDKREGNVDILFSNSKDGTQFKVTDQITGGKLGGMLEVRDKVVNGVLDKLDHMAYTLADSVNEVHTLGYDQEGRQATNFFSHNKPVKDYSANIELNPLIQKDVSYIASALVPNAPADNRIANSISTLQNKPLFNGKDTVDDFYNGMVGELSVVTKKARMMHEHQQEALTQLKSIRESISGVSLDEETVKMIEFQKAFDASAKLIKTADEMLDTVINLKR
jgi:flagellar hook-associated protein 1 FlgK